MYLKKNKTKYLLAQFGTAAWILAQVLTIIPATFNASVSVVKKMNVSCYYCKENRMWWTPCRVSGTPWSPQATLKTAAPGHVEEVALLMIWGRDGESRIQQPVVANI